jgi:hypothetical protein
MILTNNLPLARKHLILSINNVTAGGNHLRLRFAEVHRVPLNTLYKFRRRIKP